MLYIIVLSIHAIKYLSFSSLLRKTSSLFLSFNVHVLFTACYGSLVCGIVDLIANPVLSLSRENFENYNMDGK